MARAPLGGRVGMAPQADDLKNATRWVMTPPTGEEALFPGLVVVLLRGMAMSC